MFNKQNAQAQLRRRAEVRLHDATSGAEMQEVGTDGDPERLIHELRVHQIELEMQHEVLADALAEANRLRMKYHDLYEFAPVGYFTLEVDGKVVEVNLKGAAMLSRERGKLIGQNLRSFFEDGSLPDVEALLERAAHSAEEATAQTLMLRRHWPMPMCVNAQARAYREPMGDTWLRLVLMDVTALKMATDDVVRSIAKTSGQAPL
jgi:PAS domain-containing protein